jgi:hypothetical protein
MTDLVGGPRSPLCKRGLPLLQRRFRAAEGSRQLSRHLPTSIFVGVLLVSGGPASASTLCTGPEQCCPSQLAVQLSAPAHVAIGVVLVGLYNVNEKASTWDADYYLYETWKQTPNFSPHTEVVNELTRGSEQFDSVDLRRGECIRTRRIYSTVHNEYNLRRFPFDKQRLQLVFSDADYDSQHVAYESHPYSIGVSADGAV